MKDRTDRSPITIVAFGDSITQAAEQAVEDRWPEILRRSLQERLPEPEIRMVNAGVGGNTSREGLARIEQDVLRHTPRIVTVEFGNDATTDPQRHVSLEEFAGNLGAIRRKLAAHCGARLVLMTFPPVVDEWHSEYTNEFYRQQGGQDACQDRYRQCTRETARELGCPLVDVYAVLREAMSVEGPAAYILPDGVHLTARANQRIARLMTDFLAADLAASPMLV